MGNRNDERELQRAKTLAAQLEQVKQTLRAEDEALAALRAEHGEDGCPETVPAHIARLFDDALAPTPIHPFAPSARPRGPFVRG